MDPLRQRGKAIFGNKLGRSRYLGFALGDVVGGVGPRRQDDRQRPLKN
jgi:hypothetical protein